MVPFRDVLFDVLAEGGRDPLQIRRREHPVYGAEHVTDGQRTRLPLAPSCRLELFDQCLETRLHGKIIGWPGVAWQGARA